MTIEELKKLTPEEKRVQIAAFCGYTDINFYEDNAGPGYWNGYPPITIGLSKEGEWEAVKARHHVKLPDYLHSVDAMAEAESKLSDEQHTKFRAWLCVTIGQKRVVYGEDDPCACASTNERKYISATASQRADALLLAIYKSNLLIKMKHHKMIFLLPLIITGVTACGSITPIETQSLDQHETFVKTLIEEVTGVKTLP